MRLKPDSRYNGIKAEILLGAMVARSVYENNGFEFIITEGTGGSHMEGSKHYDGLAIDIRTRHVAEHLRKQLADSIRRQLTDDYDVVLHSTHIHLEFDPK